MLCGNSSALKHVFAARAYQLAAVVIPSKVSRKRCRSVLGWIRRDLGVLSEFVVAQGQQTQLVSCLGALHLGNEIAQLVSNFPVPLARSTTVRVQTKCTPCRAQRAVYCAAVGVLPRTHRKGYVGTGLQRPDFGRLRSANVD